MKVILDFAVINDEAALHDTLARALKLPAHYGRNLDALWDCLTRDVQGPVTIELRHADRASPVLQRYIVLLREAVAKRTDLVVTTRP